MKNSMLKKFGSHNMTVLNPNLCYNDVCYKGTALYINYLGKEQTYSTKRVENIQVSVIVKHK